MNQDDKDILHLTVKTAVLEGFKEYHEENVVPLQTRVTGMENDVIFIRRSARGVWGIILLIAAYLGIK